MLVPQKEFRQTIFISLGCSVSLLNLLGVQNSNIAKERKLKSAVANIELKKIFTKILYQYVLFIIKSIF